MGVDSGGRSPRRRQARRNSKGASALEWARGFTPAVCRSTGVYVGVAAVLGAHLGQRLSLPPLDPLRAPKVPAEYHLYLARSKQALEDPIVGSGKKIPRPAR